MLIGSCTYNRMTASDERRAPDGCLRIPSCHLQHRPQQCDGHQLPTQSRLQCRRNGEACFPYQRSREEIRVRSSPRRVPMRLADMPELQPDLSGK